MTVSFSTSPVQQSMKVPEDSANELRKQVEQRFPGANVTVAKVDDAAAFGFFSLGEGFASPISTSQMLEMLNTLAPNGITVAFNYKEASEEELKKVFHTPAPEMHTIKLKRFTHLTPEFMKGLAIARPRLTQIDLRDTKNTFSLADAYLQEQKQTLSNETRQARQQLAELMEERNSICAEQEGQRDKQTERQLKIKEVEEEISKIRELETYAANIQNPSAIIQVYINNFTSSRTELDQKLAILIEEEKKATLEIEKTEEQLKIVNEKMASCRASFFDIEEITIFIKVSCDSLSPGEKKSLHNKYPDAAFIDGSTHLDLSDTNLSIEKIKKKIQAQPVKTVDLRNVLSLDLFTLYSLEKQFTIEVACLLPETLTIPKQTAMSGENSPTTIEEIDLLLQRFKKIETVQLNGVKLLTAMDIVYLEDTFPHIQFIAPPQQEYTLPLFDSILVEKLCKRFPNITLHLLNTTLEDEKTIALLVDAYKGVDFRSSTRIQLLLQDVELLKFYLKRTLTKEQTNTLSRTDLETLAVKCPSIGNLIEKIIQSPQLILPIINEINALQIPAADAKQLSYSTEDTAKIQEEKPLPAVLNSPTTVSNWSQKMEYLKDHYSSAICEELWSYLYSQPESLIVEMWKSQKDPEIRKVLEYALVMKGYSSDNKELQTALQQYQSTKHFKISPKNHVICGEFKDLSLIASIPKYVLIDLDLLRKIPSITEVKTLGEALKETSTITLLSVRDLSAEGVKKFLEALKKNRTITSLSIGNLSPGGAKELLEVLKVSSTLTSLNLYGNTLGAEGGKELGELLKVNKTLALLGIGYNKLGSEGGKEIGEALKVNRTLTSLNLWHKYIGSEEGKAFGEALKVNNTLTSLWLGNFGTEGVKALGDALKVNSTLTSLSFRGDYIGSEGVRALAEVLKVNSTLTSFNLVSNELGREGVKAFVEALKANSTLTSLYLWSNNLNPADQRAIDTILAANKAQALATGDS